MMSQTPNLSVVDRAFWAIQDRLDRLFAGTQFTLLSFACFARQRISRDPALREQFRMRSLWYRGLLDERAWQRHYHLHDLEAFGSQADAQNRNLPVTDPLIVDFLTNYEHSEVKLLDVGPGALTKIGWSFPGKVIHVTPVDPLARYYARILRRRRINPIFPTRPGFGETLLGQFAPDSFDLAYARNSLDHARDPLLIINNMIAVVKPKGLVVLRHYKDEGAHGGYVGLHQWNFDCRDGAFVIWNERVHHNVNELMRDYAVVKCSVQSAAEGKWADQILVTIRRE